MLVKLENGTNVIYIEASMVRGLKLNGSTLYVETIERGRSDFAISTPIDEAAKRINTGKAYSARMAIPLDAGGDSQSADSASFMPLAVGVMFGMAMGAS